MEYKLILLLRGAFFNVKPYKITRSKTHSRKITIYYYKKSKLELDRVRFDNYDDQWNVLTRPHHYHPRHIKAGFFLSFLFYLMLLESFLVLPILTCLLEFLEAFLDLDLEHLLVVFYH